MEEKSVFEKMTTLVLLIIFVAMVFGLKLVDLFSLQLRHIGVDDLLPVL